jgi:hypothetical protein
MVRIFNDELRLSNADDCIQQIPYPEFERDLEVCLKRLDTIQASALRLSKKNSRFYQDIGVSGFNTRISLSMSFEPVGEKRNSFCFRGFGIVTDKNQKNDTSQCALVVPQTTMDAKHNVLRIEGLSDRFQLLRHGKIVSIEIHQLIDPFNEHPAYRILLKFKIRKKLLSGWHISEGLFFMWEPELRKFLPSGCTSDLSISR